MNRSYLCVICVLIFFGVFPALAAAATVSSSTVAFFPRPSPCAPLGDVNGDVLVTADDSGFIGEVLKSSLIPTEAQTFEADVNNDGRITATDFTEVVKYTRGTTDAFSGCVPYALALARAERDARRLADLSVIQKVLKRYARDTGTYPTYSLLGTPSSDDYWRSNTAGMDLRKKLKPYLNPLPVDPLNTPLENFRYVYATIPVFNPPWGALCAGNTVLFATRVETSAAGHEECDLGDGKNHFTRIITSNKTALSNDFFASALVSFWRLFSSMR